MHANIGQIRSNLLLKKPQDTKHQNVQSPSVTLDSTLKNPKMVTYFESGREGSLSPITISPQCGLENAYKYHGKRQRDLSFHTM